jgi:lysophospholipase L1-like esterase
VRASGPEGNSSTDAVILDLVSRDALRRLRSRVGHARKIYLVIAGAGAAGVLAVLLLWSDPFGTARSPATSVVSVTRTATCEESRSGAGTIRWTARYRSTLRQGPPLIQLISAGRDAKAVPDIDNQPWTLWWVASDGMGQQDSGSVTHLATIRASAAIANLLAPDHACSLVLSGSAVARPVAVIGDSVFQGVQSHLTALPQPEAYARSWLISAMSGFGWGASAPTWPLSTIGGSWAIGIARGLDSHDPSALVVELGANDSIRATFADALHQPAKAVRIRAAVTANISEVLAQSARLGIPTVLVTAPTFPNTLFGGGLRYQREAQLIDSIIRSAAATAEVQGNRVVVADWATLSAPHHLAQNATGNWFTPDGLHPNQTGEAALVGLVRRATEQLTRPDKR